jgi:hypothetical protein
MTDYADPRGRYLVAAETEPDGVILTTLVRAFVRAALRQPAVTTFVREHLFDGEEPPAGVGDALRVAIVEVLGSTTGEEWDRIASALLAYTRDCMADGSVAFPPAAPARGGWAPGVFARRGWVPPVGWFSRPSRRKAPVRAEPAEILDWLTERGSATTREIAEHFDISESSVRWHADTLVHQGRAFVTPGDPFRPRVYSIRRPPDPPAEEAQPGRTCPSSGIELDVSTRTTITSGGVGNMTTEEQQAEIAVGENYGEGLWRIKEAETGNVLRDAITSEREYLWLLDTFNHGDEYANEQQARRDAAVATG